MHHVPNPMFETTNAMTVPVSSIPTPLKFWDHCRKPIISSVVLLGFGALILENYTRRTEPKSLIRPSVAIDALGSRVRDGMTWLGWQLARMSDLYDLVKNYIIEDLRTLTMSTINFCATPFYLVKGYHDYYTVSMTPLSYGIIGSGLCLFGGALVWKWVGAPVPTQIQNLGDWVSKTLKAESSI